MIEKASKILNSVQATKAHVAIRQAVGDDRIHDEPIALVLYLQVGSGGHYLQYHLETDELSVSDRLDEILHSLRSQNPGLTVFFTDFQRS